MKILMLTDFYPPMIGGGARHVQSLSVKLAEMGHEVDVCSLTSRSSVDPSVKRGGRIRLHGLEGLFSRMPYLYSDRRRKWPPPVSDPMLSKAIASIIRSEGIDIVHAHGRMLYSYLPLKRKFAIPLIVTLHAYGFVCPKANLMFGNRICELPFTSRCISCGSRSLGLGKSFLSYCGVKSGRHKLKLVDKFIAVSSFLKRVHSDYLDLREDKIVMIPNLYEMSEENEQEIRGVAPGLPNGDFVLFVGALMPDKGVNVLLTAHNIMNVKPNLVVIGRQDPAYRYVGKNGVTVIEDAPRETVLAAYSRCRLVVVPSIWPDPCPTVALEAMAHKKPVVASAIGGLEDIVVEGLTGLLVPPGDPIQLMEAVTRTLRDRQISEQMGRSGYDRLVSSFSAARIVPQIEEIYELALAGR